MADGEAYVFGSSITDASQKERHLYEELEIIEKGERKEYRTYIKELDQQLFTFQNVSTQNITTSTSKTQLEELVTAQLQKNSAALGRFSVIRSIFDTVAVEKKKLIDALLQNGSDKEDIYKKTYAGNKLRKEITKKTDELRTRLESEQAIFIARARIKKDFFVAHEKEAEKSESESMGTDLDEDNHEEFLHQDEPDDLLTSQSDRKYALSELGRVIVPKREAFSSTLVPEEDTSARAVAKEKSMRLFSGLDTRHPIDELGRPIPQKKEAPNWELEPQENTETLSLQELQQEEYEKIKQELESRLNSERGTHIDIEATQLTSGLLSTEKVARVFQTVLLENRQKIEQYRGMASVRLRENQTLYGRIENLLQLIAQNIHNQEDEYRVRLQDLQARVSSNNAFVLQKQREEARAEDLEKRSGVPRFEKTTLDQNQADIDARQKAKNNAEENELQQQKMDVKDGNIRLIQQATQEEIQKQQITPNILTAFQETEAAQNTLNTIQKILRKQGLDPAEFMRDVKGSGTLSKLKTIVMDSKKVSYSFPVFTLSVALAVDILEWANAALQVVGVGFGILALISIIKWGVFIPIIFISTFGDVSFIEKRIIKKYILQRYQIQILSLLAELIPVIGSFWPGTFLFVLFVVNAKTKAGKLLLELAKNVKKGGVL